MISIYILFISLSWLISIIIFSFLKVNILLKDYEIKNLINSDSINRYLGIHLFSFIIRNSPVRFLNLAVYSKNKSFQELRREIRNAERGHLFAFYLVLMSSAVYLIFVKNTTDYLYINLWNIVFNGYPVLSLQVQKKRVHGILKKNKLGT